MHNVGSIFRTADAAGVSHIVLSGYTPTPIDRFGLPRTDFAKVSLGAESTVPWQKTATFSSAVSILRKKGCMIVAVEQSEHSTSLFSFKAAENTPIALVLGNEVRGISKQSLSLCDAIVEIPMKGKKESLNVSVSAGIAMYHFCV